MGDAREHSFGVLRQSASRPRPAHIEALRQVGRVGGGWLAAGSPLGLVHAAAVRGRGSQNGTMVVSRPGRAGDLPARRRRADPRRDPDDVGCRLPGRRRGGSGQPDHPRALSRPRHPIQRRHKPVTRTELSSELVRRSPRNHRVRDRPCTHKDRSGRLSGQPLPIASPRRTAGVCAVIKSFSHRWLQRRPGYSPAGQATRAVYLYIAALIANVLICVR
jgi:hypothetical protein